jgi:hypothetical protein
MQRSACTRTVGNAKIKLATARRFLRSLTVISIPFTDSFQFRNSTLMIPD